MNQQRRGIRTDAALRLSGPIRQEDQQVAAADGAIVVEVGWTVIAVVARAPIREQNEHITRTNDTVAVEVADHLTLVRNHIAIYVHARAVDDVTDVGHTVPIAVWPDVAV